MSNPIPLNKGSDLPVTYTWPNGAGGGANLTGFSAEIYDASAGIAPYLVAVISDAPLGKIAVTLTWNDAIASQTVHSFRLRITSPSGFRTSSSLITVSVQ